MNRIAPAIVLTAALCGVPILSAQGLPGMAAGVLEQARLARQAIADRNQNAALDHVHQAQSLMAEIHAQTAGQPQPVLIPVQSTTETTTTYTDVKRAKNGEPAANRMKKNTHVSDTQQQTTAEEMNTTSAQANLDAAQAALQRVDWTGADTALAEVANLIRTTGADRPVPLLQARQNLLLARDRVASGDYHAAVAPLREAEHSLADFERQDHGSLGQQAEDMRQDIEGVARNIKRTNAPLDRIDDWLHTIQRWQETAHIRFQPAEPWLR